MEQYNFDRKYSLSVTKPIKLFKQDALKFIKEEPQTPSSISWQAAEDYNAVTVLTTTITDLQIQAEIAGTSDTTGSDTKKTTIKIYNLSKQTRENICNKDNTVILKAGYKSYEDDLPIIFSGQVVSFTTDRSGADMITTLECADGQIPITTTRVSVRVPSGKTYRDVFLTLAEEFKKAGVATGRVNTDYQLLLSDDNADLTPSGVGDLTPDLSGIEDGLSPSYAGLSQTLPPQDIVLFKGWSYTGKLRKALDELSEQFNHSWYILNNRLYIQPKYYEQLISVVLLDENQILSIETDQDGTETGSTTTEKAGLKIKTLLDGRMQHSSLLRITAGDKRGDYPITSAKHSLDYEGGSWFTTIEVGGIKTK